jgi:hypothetical protein
VRIFWCPNVTNTWVPGLFSAWKKPLHFYKGKSLNSLKTSFPFKLVNQNPIVFFFPTRLLANIICVICFKLTGPCISDEWYSVPADDVPWVPFDDVVFETEKYHRKYETTFTSKIIDPLDFEPTWFYEFHISRQKIQMILKLKKCQKYLWYQLTVPHRI